MHKLKSLLLASLAAALFSGSACADQSPDIAPAPTDEVPASPAKLTIRLNVPQMNKAKDLFTVFPYTVKPPRKVHEILPLPEKLEELQQRVYGTGYAARVSMNKPYAEGGWRWHYAYKHALARAGGYQPPTLVGLASWQKEMARYLKPECERINKIEELRQDNYKKMVQDYEDNHKDEEMEALRKGLDPVPVTLKPARKGLEAVVTLKPGEWWITGQHRVPGLTYFYMYNLKLGAGESKTVELSDVNAILIQGGW